MNAIFSGLLSSDLDRSGSLLRSGEDPMSIGFVDDPGTSRIFPEVLGSCAILSLKISYAK